MSSRVAILKGIAHNLADSVASGIGLMIGVYQMDIFGEASRAPEGYIEVDFLTGTTSGGQASPSLARALQIYSHEALPRLCASHEAAIADFRRLNVRFWQGPIMGRFQVTVEDQQGRVAVAEYDGSPGQRVKVLDDRGRVRPK